MKTRFQSEDSSEHYFHVALGQQREVEALLPDRAMSVESVPVARIRPNPFQVRSLSPYIDNLADTLRVQGQTLVFYVRPDPSEAGYYQLMCGERWLNATREANIVTVICGIAAYTDEDLLEIALLENIKVQALEPLEEAFAFRMIIDQGNYTVTTLAGRLNTSPQTILQRLQLLDAPPLPTRRRTRPAQPEKPPLGPVGPANGAQLDEAAAKAKTEEDINIERDTQIVRTILARWQELLDQRTPNAPQVIASLNELAGKITQLIQKQ